MNSQRVREIQASFADRAMIPMNYDIIDDAMCFTFLVPGLDKAEMTLDVSTDGFLVLLTDPACEIEGQESDDIDECPGFSILRGAAMAYLSPTAMDLRKIASKLRDGLLYVTVPMVPRPQENKFKVEIQ